ncbi:MAG: M61 family metallopeptidase [Cytophagales bacterium]
MQYQISFLFPQKQIIDIKIELEKGDFSTILLQIPAWRPGRYELQNYARNILNFKVFDENNQVLDWIKVNRNSWKVETSIHLKTNITYSYYASQMDAGGSWLDANQLYINPINCLMYVKDRENEPIEFSLNLPDDYKIVTGLPYSNSEKLLAKNYLQLADSPIIASKDLQTFTFHINSIAFNICIEGNCKPDWARFEADFTKFIQSQIAVFGTFPERNYYFLFQILPYSFYHGVEHRNSTVITLGPDEKFGNDDFYTNLLGISSHELFHAWNICKIRPMEMMPYDLQKENYFSTGFIAEGVTTYYGDLMLFRAEVWTMEVYFSQLNANINAHFSSAARNTVSLVQSSLDLWVDGYGKTHPQRKVSIYDKGAIVSLILDIEIRRESQNIKSLDDVMRYLWTEFGQKSIGYSMDDYKNAVEGIIGKPMGKYFDDCIFGCVPLERILAKNLDYLGLVLQIEHPSDILEQKFGLRLSKTGEKWNVLALDTTSPAEKALSLKDEIISINGFENSDAWQKMHDNQALNIILNRAGKEITKTLISDQGNYFPVYSIRHNANSTELQLNNFKKWRFGNFSTV